jgi:hypothetical protein
MATANYNPNSIVEGQKVYVGSVDEAPYYITTTLRSVGYALVCDLTPWPYGRSVAVGEPTFLGVTYLTASADQTI